MEQAENDLDQVVGYRLKETQSLLRTRMDASLREIGLTTPQYVCMELLSRTPGASNSDLARGSFVTRQTMNALLKGLQERGLVERAAQASTGRTLPTTLTPEGVQLLERGTRRIRDIERRMTDSLTAGQKQALLDALVACADALR